MTATPIDPASFEPRLAVALKQVLDLQRERADHLVQLAKSPDDAGLEAALDALDDELRTWGSKVERLQAARAEASRRFTSAARREYLAGLRREAERAAQMRAAMVRRTTELVAQIEGPLAQYLAEMAELDGAAKSLAYGVVRAGQHSGGFKSTDLYRVSGADRGAMGVCARVLQTALWRAGLGRALPQLGITVPAPPDTQGRAGQYLARTAAGEHVPLETLDLAALARELYAREEDRMQHALGEALAAVEARIVEQEKSQ